MCEKLDFLKEPFRAEDIEWRIMRSGKQQNGVLWAVVAPYLTNRAIMDRLDITVGPGKWMNEFKAGPDGGVLCGISIRVNDEWVTKWDGAANSSAENVKGDAQAVSIKGGLSASMKRAAVQWGIGRYLYDVPEGWAIFDNEGVYTTKINGTYQKWDPPRLPDFALPEEEKNIGNGKGKKKLTEEEVKMRQEASTKIFEMAEGDLDVSAKNLQVLMGSSCKLRELTGPQIKQLHPKVTEQYDKWTSSHDEKSQEWPENPQEEPGVPEVESAVQDDLPF